MNPQSTKIGPYEFKWFHSNAQDKNEMSIISGIMSPARVSYQHKKCKDDSEYSAI